MGGGQNDYNTGVLKREKGRGSQRIELYATLQFAQLAARGLKYLPRPYLAPTQALPTEVLGTWLGTL